MPLQLQTKNNSLLIKSLIIVINKALEDSKSNSVIDVIFQNDVDFIQFNYDGEKLILKDDLKELIGLVGKEEAIIIFVNRLNAGLYNILNQLMDWEDLNYQFSLFKEAIHHYLFNIQEKLNDDILFKLHQDGLITLSERKYKNVAVKSTFGSNDFTFRFKFPEGSYITTTHQMINHAISITNRLIKMDSQKLKKYTTHFKENPSGIKKYNILEPSNLNFNSDDREHFIFNKYYTKEEVVTSTLHTLANKFEDLDIDSHDGLEKSKQIIGSTIDKLAKEKPFNKYTFTESVIIISIIYFKNLYIGRMDKPSSKNKNGINLIFDMTYNMQRLNLFKRQTIKYDQLHLSDNSNSNINFSKTRINKDFSSLVSDINELIQNHLIIVSNNGDYNFNYLSEMSGALLMYVHSVLINVTSLNKLFLYEEANTVFRNIASNINENISCIIRHSPTEFLVLLYDLEKIFNDFINNLELKESSNSESKHAISFKDITQNPLKLSADTYFSSINVSELISDQSIRKNLFK